MPDVSKVSQWVKKAVADIAAFEGKLRKIDTESEKKALSTLLAGNLSDEDKEYIEGFMLDKKSKTEKKDGLITKKNKERSVELSDDMIYDTKVYFTEEFVDGFINSLFDNKEDEFGARTINKKISEVLLSAEFELILSLDKENGYKEVVVGIEALTDHNKILFIYEDGTSKELGDIIKEEEEKKAKEKAMRDIPEFIKRKVSN